MAKTSSTKTATDDQAAAVTPADSPAPAPVPEDRVPPRIGDMVYVMPVPGRKVFNLEVGTFFEEGVYTPQTVTVTTVRRLADGDLIRKP